METELKLLDKNYIETRIGEFKEIRSKQVAYKIEDSNRENSASVYVRFYIVNKKGDGESYFGGTTVRISDHPLSAERLNTNSSYKQFIVKPNMVLCKKRKAMFVKVLENAIKETFKTSFRLTLKNLSVGENVNG